ncbi:hypothetical protein [Novosphingobium sp.]|uniref:hypothetical protein n=1 Tax=Novosphingobium sp. TaxID=1874826 RepID=UPI001DA05B62|nr:hypothetical protein [Novosphingobium sp.]MBX9662673.1 hypothetical protein [Novosphingobium sp.]
MSLVRNLVWGAALTSLGAAELAAAQEPACLSEREVTSLVTYALPVVMDSTMKTCRPQLSPQGYFATQGSSLVQRYAARKSAAWPEARAALVKLGGNDDKLKDIVSSLSDEALQPFAEGMVAAVVTRGIKPGQCKAIERATRLLSPLPPENTAELVTFVLVMADKPKVRGAVGASKKSDLPICPAA